METPGAIYHQNGLCTFRVWAPLKDKMLLHLLHPLDWKIQMQSDGCGYFECSLENILPGSFYYYRPNDLDDYPDPASYSQPEGVHGPSMVVDHHAFCWEDEQWKGIPQAELIFYELHVGTFTPKGTFEAIIARLDELLSLGINALELMPVAQFPGERNWGYDGVYPYAVQCSYGGPEGLKALVNACHKKGMAVFLDVVYNHLGPEGNYLKEFGPYFTDKYNTPWGPALNYDDEWSDGIREYFCANISYLFEHFHLDGLRLDAIHTIYDNGAVHFWTLVNRTVSTMAEQSGRPLLLIAESDLNSPRVLDPVAQHGYGFDAQWLDDFHHALYVLLDKNGQKFYVDFGAIEQLAKAYNEGFVHSGEFVKARKRKYGASSAGIAGRKFVAFTQNHDQVGNRVNGERLSVLVSDINKLKIAAAALILSPYLPLLFMGEEYAEDAPFLYFVNHADKQLIEAVRVGRKEQFKALYAGAEPPDPQAKETFDQSKINWEKRNEGYHYQLRQWYQQLIAFRKVQEAVRCLDKNKLKAVPIGENGLSLLRWNEDATTYMLAIFNFSKDEFSYALPNLPLLWEIKLEAVTFPQSDQQRYKQGEVLKIQATNVLILSGKPYPCKRCVRP